MLETGYGECKEMTDWSEHDIRCPLFYRGGEVAAKSVVN